MSDVFHQWGSDIMIGPTGDLAAAADPVLGKQRVLRRLLTNPGDYIWQPAYGVGLASFIGQPANPLQIRALVRSQIFMESTVARNPEPVIDVVASPGGAPGDVYLHICYVDTQSGQTQVLTFSASA